jgi:hypothetical protein
MQLSALGRRRDNSSPSRNVVLSQPLNVTGVTGRAAHWGNCAATSRAATDGAGVTHLDPA